MIVCRNCDCAQMYPNDDLFCEYKGLHRPLVSILSTPSWCPLQQTEKEKKTMTWLEAFKKDHPTLSEGYIIAEFCPVDGLVSMCPEIDGEVDCIKCWNRQMPEDSEGPDR